MPRNLGLLFDDDDLPTRKPRLQAESRRQTDDSATDDGEVSVLQRVVSRLGR